MHEELKRAVEAARAHPERLEKNPENYSTYRRFLARHGDTLIAAVELAEAFDRRANEVNEESDGDGFSRVQYFADGRLFKAWAAFRTAKNGSKA